MDPWRPPFRETRWSSAEDEVCERKQGDSGLKGVIRDEHFSGISLTMAMWYPSLLGVLQSRECQSEALEAQMPKSESANMSCIILTPQMKPFERNEAFASMLMEYDIWWLSWKEIWVYEMQPWWTKCTLLSSSAGCKDAVLDFKSDEAVDFLDGCFSAGRDIS